MKLKCLNFGDFDRDEYGSSQFELSIGYSQDIPELFTM